ncbi:MAG: DNA polymerase IV [Candidatus Lambdaproteobacteria bacterium]|nr:DNA polymerase IV [Candidatus Lambdaproteobacteria bacterium]
MESAPRKIIHVDMDAFYASVEIRDNPALRGRPVVVGGSPNSRGVVAAASYEARKFGIHSAMPCAQAARRCPQAVFVPPNFDKYRQVSRQIHAIFQRYTTLVEPLALDEAYLDVTENIPRNPSATRIAEEIKAAIRAETQLTASAGVAPNKFLAKVASEERKPDGLFVIRPEMVDEFLVTLPLSKVPGVGPVTLAQLQELGAVTCGQLQQVPREVLEKKFGKRGEYFYRMARGQDDRPVNPHRERKSVSVEDTFAEDHDDAEWLLAKLGALAASLARRLEANGARGRTLTLKLRLADFSIHTRSITVPDVLADAEQLLELARGLYADSGLAGRKLRLLGLGVSHLEREDAPEPYEQLRLDLRVP